MNSMRTDVGNFRLKRKCSTFSGRWLLMLSSLLLLVAYVSCRPSNDEYDGFDDEYPDVDNVEIHRVKIVDGVMHAEDHPVIFYKEDFVSEDYDPDKHKNAAGALRPRKYKDISRRHRYNRTDGEHYRALKPEKIYFDVLPQTPVVTADDSSANDSNFDVSKIRVEVLSLADDTAEVEQEDEDEISKQILSKRPKKYRRRMRRDTLENEHRVQKRNPRYAQGYENILQNIFSPQNIYVRHPVRGKYYNPLSVAGPALNPIGFEIAGRFGPENEPDRVPWGSRQYDNKVSTTQRPMPPLFHDSRPENADVSFLTTRRPQQTSTTNSVPPLFHNSNPNNWDTSFLQTRRPIAESPTTSRPITTRRTTQNPQINQISNCVWAIVECCSRRNQNIRYQCFELKGCFGAFWDLNPCADRIQDQALNYVNKYLD